MKILAIERSGASTDDGTALPAVLLRDEARRLWTLHRQGAVREMYFDESRHAAVLVLECGDGAEAEYLLASLPLVAAGAIRFEVIPLVPYDGFERLFAD